MAYDLKNEEDVKEYLKNLHIEYKFGCYSEKKPEGKWKNKIYLSITSRLNDRFAVCHLLGDFHEAVKGEMENAAATYKANCDEYNYGKSCAKYGDFKAIGESTHDR